MAAEHAGLSVRVRIIDLASSIWRGGCQDEREIQLITTEDRQRESTILSVRHRTVFEYGGPVWNRVNTLHLEPRSYPMQKTLGSIVKVIPKTRLGRYEDLFGNTFRIAGGFR